MTRAAGGAFAIHAKRKLAVRPERGEGLVNPVGRNLIAPQIDTSQRGYSGATKPGLGPAADLLSGIAQKVGKEASPEPRCSLWCSQRAGPAQIARKLR